MARNSPAGAREGLIALADGVRLWAWDTGGAGAPIVLAHPHSGNHSSWDLQRKAFQAAGRRVIGYSRRGYWRSERGPASDLGTQAGDLAALLDAMAVETCHVVGSAAGGSTALDFALAYPMRAQTAIVASSLMSIDEPDYQALSARLRGPWFDALPPEAKELGPSYRALCPKGVAAWRQIHDLNGFGATNPPVRQPLAATITWRTLGANAVPMLLLTGDADLYLPPAVLRYVAPQVGAAQAEIITDAGHPTFLEAPETFNRLALEFFADQS